MRVELITVLAQIWRPPNSPCWKHTSGTISIGDCGVLWTMRRAARSTTLRLTFTRTPWRTVAPIRAHNGSSTKLASMNRILLLMIRYDRAPNDFQSNVSMKCIFVRESPTQPIFTRLVFFPSSVFEIESARRQSK